ncbi:serine/threonine-protein kinase [Tessaracoccus sp. OH4464_COT-324]|uniref:serine/threonine-protein kinase n=1 Tax=Tessaracoccus sp. OH4464_COT-324 TaxID=2491059 RepID=UPI001319D599|nr:serine/threonine-protein kinase [Tessaracoccus sp. OH4464_COT-324]
MEMIGRYRVTGKIGSGSFATVFEGYDDTLQVPVAIKVLSPAWATNEDVRTRFLAEARLLRQFSDDRLLRVFDIGTTVSGQPYFVMELANGGSLENLRRRPVQPGIALRLCAQAARSLTLLHKKHIIHRDVTPGNVLLMNTAEGTRVLLADLGVAKSLLDEHHDEMTGGTPAYMALEQARGSQLDERSDIYSLGCVSYSLLTGHPPFPVKTIQDVLSRNPMIGPVPIAARVGAPAALDTFFDSVLSPDPNRRPQTAERVAEILDELADRMGGNIRIANNSAYVARPAPALAPATPSPPTSPPGPAIPADTPGRVLNAYLGQGKYAPRKSKETHQIWFWVWVIASTLALGGLAWWVTVVFLSG